MLAEDRAALLLTFEYGPKSPGPERPPSSASGRDVFRQARTPFAPSNGDWVGVSEFLHPVFRFHFPRSLPPPPARLDPPRPFDIKQSSWNSNLFVDPFFRKWW
eukprot:SAG31_NODE_26583_length_440_cov_0.536657_1_plen_102_part_01